MQKKSLASLLVQTGVTVSLVGVLLLSGAGVVFGGEGLSYGCCPEESKQVTLKLTEPYMSGEEVLEIQTALSRLGFYSGALNGMYDPPTESAAKDFQLSCSLPPDGVIGKKTRKALIRRFEEGHTAVNAVPRGDVEILIDVDRKSLTVYENKKVFKKFRVAVGKPETPSPIGNWKITRKAKDWGTGFGTRWLGLNVTWGLYGIHGTNKPWSIGGEESHGCFRMFNRDVEQLYEWVKPGTRVLVIGTVYSPYYEQRDKVFNGSKGTAVVYVQQGLIREGYLKPPADGIFGYATEAALKKLQKDKGLEVTGQVDVDVWGILGL